VLGTAEESKGGDALAPILTYRRRARMGPTLQARTEEDDAKVYLCTHRFLRAPFPSVQAKGQRGRVHGVIAQPPNLGERDAWGRERCARARY